MTEPANDSGIGATNGLTRECIELRPRYSPTGEDCTHWYITTDDSNLGDGYGVWVANEQCAVAMASVYLEKGRTQEEACANAQLIALAPELASSLKAALRYILDKCPPTGDDEDRVGDCAITLWAALSEDAWDEKVMR